VGAVRRQSGQAPEPAPPAAEADAGPADQEAPAPAPAVTPADASATGPSAPMPSRDALVQAWGDHIIGRLRPKAKALFQAGRFVGVDDDHAVFGLPNETHRTRCLEVQGEIEAALSDHFGRPVGLELVVDDGAAAGPAEHVPAPVSASPTVPPGASGARSRPVPEPVGGATDGGGADDGPDDLEDLSVFDEAELGEVADIDNSAQARVLQAFPGAEEVT
jgi:DNA polymerase-3 subunit gamma/tau